MNLNIVYYLRQDFFQNIMHPKSSRRFFLILIYLIIQSGISLKAQFFQAISNMDKFNSLTANEQVYVHTDCEVYAPGDTIWFKAYIRNKASMERTNLSRMFYLNLVNKYGKIVVEKKFVITNAGLFVKNLKFNEYWFMIGWISSVDIIIHIFIVENFYIPFI